MQKRGLWRGWKKRNEANERCREAASSRHDYESVTYFQNLIFATKQAIEIVKEEM